MAYDPPAALARPRRSDRTVFWVLAAVLLLAGILLRVFSYQYLSPFVRFPEDLFDPLSAWARECFDPARRQSHAWIDSVLALGIFLFMGQIYRMLRPHFRLCIPFGKWWLDWVLLATLLAALGLDWAENILIGQGRFDLPLPGRLKAIAYGLAMLILVFLGVRTTLDTRWARWQEKLAYLYRTRRFLYPSLVYILALAALFLSLGSLQQFQALFVELTGSFNFGLFSLVFLLSIFLVWFVPDYLFFTHVLLRYYHFARQRQALPDAEKLLDIRTLVYPVNWVAALPYARIKQAYRKELVYPQEGRAPFYYDLNGAVLYHPVFNVARRILAVSFILLLLYLLSDAGWDTYLNVRPILVLGGVLLLVYLYYRHLIRRLPDQDTRSKENERLSNRAVAIWVFGPLIAFLMGNLAVHAFNLGNGLKAWPIRHLFFIGTTAFSLFAFLGFAYARRQIRASQTKGENYAPTSLIGLWLRAEHGLTLLLILAGVFIPLLMGWALLIWTWIDINGLGWLNPITFFLVAVNGIISTLAVIDRLYHFSSAQRSSPHRFHLWGRLKRSGPQPSPADAKAAEEGRKVLRSRNFAGLALLSCAILIWLATCRRDNQYHTVPYISHQPPPSLMDLPEFTRQFLDRMPADTTAPIYFVAAEGGGLRAAYWTMLILQEMDRRSGQRFFPQVFLMTGASGGMVGQGMYTFLKSQGLPPEEIRTRIDTLGGYNFLSGDLSGIFGKGFLSTLWKVSNLECWENRSEAMARQYFTLAGESDSTYRFLRNRPFSYLWTRDAYRRLPLLFVNTTRSEDGRRGVVHPLRPGFLEDTGLIDLTTNPRHEYISYPDGLFLTNRFPGASPAASIEGHGHFVDGGYLENSGLKTVLHLLTWMKARAGTQAAFRDFLRRPVVVMAISNSSSGYIESSFEHLQDSTNRNLYRAELPQILSAVASVGTSALPHYYQKLFRSHPDLRLLSLPLPYQLENEDIHEYFKGQVASCRLDQALAEETRELDSLLRNSPLGPAWYSRGAYLPVPDPPLGRILASPTLLYMQKMIRHPRLDRKLDSLATAFIKGQDLE